MSRKSKFQRRKEYAMGMTAGIVAVSDDRSAVEFVAKIGRLAEERLSAWPPATPAPQPGPRAPGE